MTQINWGILDPNAVSNAGLAVRQGMEIGQKFRRDSETSKALGVLAMDPMNQQATSELAKWNPELGYKVAGDQRKQAQEEREADLRRRAYDGDAGAQRELFGIDREAVKQLDDRTHAKLKQSVDFISNAALQIDRLPEEARAGAWAQYVQLAESRGMDIPTEYERYSPQVLSAAISEAGAMSKLLEGRDPRYQVIPEGGMLVNTRDPAALAQVGAGGAPQAAPQGGVSEDQAAPIIQQAMRSKIITPEDFAAIQQSLGPNGQQAAQQWMQQNGIQVGKQINGKTYVQRGGEWFEVN